MIITLFRSRLTSQAGDDYSAMAAEMLERARTYPGFIAMKEFQAEDGERLTVVWWETTNCRRPGGATSGTSPPRSSVESDGTTTITSKSQR